MIFELLGYTGAILFLVGDAHYIHDTITGSTRPHRISMGIFLAMNAIDLANQFASGATHSLWLFVASFITTAIVFVIALKKGSGGTERLDWIVLAGGVLGLVLWAWLRTPLASIVCNFVVTTIAMIPIFKKSYLDPASEAPYAWLLCGLGSVVATVSVGQWSPQLLLLPAHAALVELAVWVIVVWRRRSVPARGSATSDPHLNLV